MVLVWLGLTRSWVNENLDRFVEVEQLARWYLSFFPMDSRPFIFCVCPGQAKCAQVISPRIQKEGRAVCKHNCQIVYRDQAKARLASQDMDRVPRHGLPLYQHIPLQVLEAGIHPYVPPDGTCFKSDSMCRVSVPTPLKLPAILLIRTPFWPPRIEQGSCTISVVNLSIEVVFEGRAGSTRPTCSSTSVSRLIV